MTEKKTKTAPTVTDTTTKPIEEPVKEPDVASEALAPQPFQLIPPFTIPGKAKTMAKAAGFDLSGIEEMGPTINKWAGSVEERLNVIINAIPQLPAETIRLLKAEAEKQRAEMTQRAPMGAAAPAQGSDLMGMIAQFLPQVLGGGSSGLSDEITKQVVDAGIKQMFAGTRLLEAIQTKIMTDMGVKAVTETLTK